MQALGPITRLTGQSAAARTSKASFLPSRSQFHSTSFVAAATTSAGKPKVLLLDQIKLATSELSQLSKVADVVESTAKTRQELIEKFKSGGEYAQVVGIYRHFGGARSIKITGRFDAELVSQLPPSLRYIVHNGAGYDQLDVNALTDKNIQASNVPTAVDDATSDVALYLLLGALRRFPLAKAQMNKGEFNSKFSFLDARDPRGKTLGIVGAGGIGRAFAHKASHALGIKVIYHNRNQLSKDVESQAAKGGMQYVKTLDELLRRSDVVSLHCPLTPATKGLIGRQQLEAMNKDAILINTARGPVVKEEELAEALEQGAIAGAGLDVFEAEPKIHPRLFALKDSKVELLPHVGTLTLETQTEMEAVCLRNLMQGLESGKLGFTVPEQKDVEFD
ncbi:related to 2-hydroxyacid dehydrogenase [Sporisorium scitamineum]|uniref:Related to 2-hydroxyacid dehydrogenase n=3 Tax=Sporisorium scitamineum TaxID=49012 RepID=A0A127Z2R1_9BASI|nr:related to 2-hydroxyacid dehydrogenase [Sporisorium scitamineum]